MLALPTPEPRRGPGSVEGKTGSIEIVLLNGGAHVSVDAFVNEKALARVLRAMKGMV